MQSTLNPDDTSDALAGVLKLPPLHLTASPLQRGPAPPRGYTTMKITTAEFGEQTGYVELAALSRAQAAAAPPQATSASRLKVLSTALESLDLLDAEENGQGMGFTSTSRGRLPPVSYQIDTSSLKTMLPESSDARAIRRQLGGLAGPQATSSSSGAASASRSHTASSSVGPSGISSKPRKASPQQDPPVRQSEGEESSTEEMELDGDYARGGDGHLRANRREGEGRRASEGDIVDRPRTEAGGGKRARKSD